MTFRDKVLRGLEACTEWGMNLDECRARGCPYLIEGDTEALMCIFNLHQDAAVLLKADEREEDDRK